MSTTFFPFILFKPLSLSKLLYFRLEMRFKFILSDAANTGISFMQTDVFQIVQISENANLTKLGNAG